MGINLDKEDETLHNNNDSPQDILSTDEDIDTQFKLMSNRQNQLEKIQFQNNEDDEDIFYECNTPDDEQFYDTDGFENIPFDVKRKYNKSFHLKINHTQLMKGEILHQYMEQDIVDEWLQNLSYDELIGNHTIFETLVFAITTVDKLQQLEKLQPKLEWKPLEVIQCTLKATT